MHAREHDPDLQDSGRFMFSVGVHAVVAVPARRQTGRCPDDRERYLDGGVILLDVASESPRDAVEEAAAARRVRSETDPIDRFAVRGASTSII